MPSLPGAPRTAAKPAVIRERMGISLLTTAQVKSHLQKYRIRVVAEGKAADAATEAQARWAAGGKSGHVPLDAACGAGCCTHMDALLLRCFCC